MTQRGYTVIEMLLVVGILAIVTSASAAHFESLTLKKDAQHLMALMNYAQRQAVESGQPYVLNMDSSANNFCLNQYKEEFRSEQMVDGCIRSLQLSGATHLEVVAPRIIFYPDSHMSTVVFRLHDRGHSIILSTEKQWGRVRIAECAGERCYD